MTRRCPELSVALALAVALLAAPSSAQPVTAVLRDGTIGGPALPGELDGVPVPPDATCTVCVPEALGERSGTNLFYSFDRFDVVAPDSVLFLTDPMVATGNVVARVTGLVSGGAPSTLAGSVGVYGSGADLFLLNPEGIVLAGGFGVELDLNATLHLSTAEQLRFVDGLFDATGASPATLLPTGAAQAFEFEARPGAGVDVQLGDEALGGIDVRRANLQSLTIAGRNISLGDGAGAGTWAGSGSRFQLAAVGDERNTVPLDLEDFDPTGIGDGQGRIEMTSNGGGDSLLINVADDDDASASGGRIVIRGGELVLEGASSTWLASGGANDSAIDVGVAGDVTLRQGVSLAAINPVEGAAPGRVVVRSGALGLSEGSSIQVFDATLSGAASSLEVGGIDIEADSVRLEDGSLIQTVATLPSGLDSGVMIGAIDIDAGSVDLASGSQVVSEVMGGMRPATPPAAGPPAGGDILIDADVITLRGDSDIVASTAGGFDAGDVTITHDATGGTPPTDPGYDLWIENGIVSSLTTGEGDGGGVDITMPRVRLGDESGAARGQISTTTEGAGAGGALVLTAEESLSIRGRRVVSGDPQNSGLFARSGLDDGSPATGAGGSATVSTGRLVIAAGGGIEAQSFGTGAAGSLDITVTGDAELRDALLSTSAAIDGETGDLALRVDGDALIADGSIVSSTGGAPVGAGPGPGPEAPPGIEVDVAGTLEIVDSTVRTDANRANSANVTVSAGRLLDVVDSRILSNIDGTGVPDLAGSQSGNIELAAATVVVDGSRVTTNVTGDLEAGGIDAGNIQINASQGLVLGGTSTIQAFSEFGTDGEIIVNGPVADILPARVALDPRFRGRGDELGESCEARSSAVGTFYVRPNLELGGSPDALLELPPLETANGASPCDTR